MLLFDVVYTSHLILSAFVVALSLYLLIGLLAIRFADSARVLQYIMSGMPSVGLVTLLLLLFNVVFQVLPAGGNSRLSQLMMPSLVVGFCITSMAGWRCDWPGSLSQHLRNTFCRLATALLDNLSAFAAIITLVEWLFSRSGVGYSFLEHLWGHEFGASGLSFCLLWGICLLVVLVLNRWSNALIHT